jgi:anti-anti-sigma factor
MKMSGRAVGDVVVVEIDGALKTPSDMDEFSMFFTKELSGASRKFALNFENVHFVNSSGLGRLILASKKVTEHKGTMVVFNLSSDIEELFTITRIKEKIPVFIDEQSAVDSLK